MVASRTRKLAILHTLLRTGDLRRLRRTLSRQDDVQIAQELDNLDVADQRRVLQLLPTERRPQVIESMRYEAAAELVAALAPEEAAHLLDDLEVDDVVDILGRLDAEQLQLILKRLDKDDANELEELLAYDENTAGGLMSPQYFRVSPDATVGDALVMIQEEEEPPETAFYVYVVDSVDERLVGVISLRMLVISRPNQTIRDIMEREVVKVTADTDQEDVAELVSRYDLVSVPVVDEHDVMLGVVEVDDVVDVIREEATEDILKMAGAGEELAEVRTFVGSFRVRWRWLLAAAAGGTAAALSLSGFDTALASVPALAFFMPVVAGMGGNVGMQSSTIVVRGLAVGFVEASRVRRLVFREVSLGASLGLLYGALIAAASMAVGNADVDAWRLGLVVMLGTAGSMTIAAAVGTCTPLVLDRFGVDPAVATGPFVTTSVDVMGLIFYFWLATVLIGI
ncbi:magnesium transporter [Paraliomyxa miuraensis]|uniref:magnesium transporter n=1 Tax=Paraliomyxa miuraensis TaxID=376150 RepID=UPI00224FAFEB|nr:magnesium transporter [Paraliomyxa miuraensis]MCX4244426.1 magnesium transporter [Paraliomyxa miuraensis]